MKTKTNAMSLVVAAILFAACGGGSPGADGTNGADGKDGKNGKDGASFLTTVTDEAAGANCVNGGAKVVVGPDTNGNGTLDTSEVKSTTFVCNGVSGDLFGVSAESVGPNCATGGLRIDAGPDTDGSGTLDPGEVTSTNYVCNGADGADGVSYMSLVTAEAAGANCGNGGLKLETGPDTDANGSLDPSEIANTSYVCNGADGADGTSFVSNVTSEPAGVNCPTGGLKVANGPDTNGDGTLQAGEVTSTSYVCNGLRSLATTTAEPAGANCTAGGARVQTGVDANGDGTLQAGEVASTTYVCNGDPVAANGATPMVSAFANDNTNAPAGGASVTTRQASITVPRSGTIMVVASAEMFCANPALGAGYDCAAGNNDGNFTITNNAAAAANTGSFSYFYLTQNSSENLNRSAIFPVAAGGTYTFYARASHGGSPGAFGVFRTELTLVFIPD